MSEHGLVRRHVPLMVRLAFLVSGKFRQGSWAFVLLSSSFSAAVLSMTELPFRSFDAVTEGEVLQVERTNVSEDELPIYAVAVLYYPGEGGAVRARKVTSFTAEPPQVGARVAVEYDSSDPAGGCMQGARSRRLSSGALLVVIFPFLALVFTQLKLGEARRVLRLLARGRLTRARLTGKGEGNVRVNNTPQSVMHFVFLDEHGDEVPFEVKTFKPERLEDDREEPTLYDPRRPRQAMTVDQLPGELEVQDGRVLAHGFLGHLLVMPLLAVASIAAAAAYFACS